MTSSIRAPDRLGITRVLGHRGAGIHAPENTLAAIRCAAKLGLQWVEFDVRQSLDGTLVLMHDETLERTTNGHGLLNDANITDLRALDAGKWFSSDFANEPIPTLGEAVDLMAGLGIAANVEIKLSPSDDPRIGAVIADLLANSWPVNFPPPIISSFDAGPLEAARGAAPELPRMLIVNAVTEDWREQIEELDCHYINTCHETLTLEAAREVCATEIELLSYTVNDPARAQELFSWGVAAVFSDVPEKIRTHAIQQCSTDPEGSG
jgi:glycerophosphoryl diester phosphodiesterase